MKVDVLAGLVGQGVGDDVAHPLCLMDDGVGERQVLPVSDLHLTVSHDPLQLLLDLVWLLKQDKITAELFTQT